MMKSLYKDTKQLILSVSSFMTINLLSLEKNELKLVLKLCETRDGRPVSPQWSSQV